MLSPPLETYVPGRPVSAKPIYHGRGRQSRLMLRFEYSAKSQYRRCAPPRVRLTWLPLRGRYRSVGSRPRARVRSSAVGRDVVLCAALSGAISRGCAERLMAMVGHRETPPSDVPGRRRRSENLHHAAVHPGHAAARVVPADDVAPRSRNVDHNLVRRRCGPARRRTESTSAMVAAERAG